MNMPVIVRRSKPLMGTPVPTLKFKKITKFKLDPRTHTIEEIIAEVADQTGIPVREIKGRGRTRAVSWARQDALREIKERVNISLTGLGEYFGLDHSTVHHNVGRAEHRYWIKEAILRALDGTLDCTLTDWDENPTTIYAIVAHNKRKKLTAKKISP